MSSPVGPSADTIRGVYVLANMNAHLEQPRLCLNVHPNPSFTIYSGTVKYFPHSVWRFKQPSHYSQLDTYHITTVSVMMNPHVKIPHDLSWKKTFKLNIHTHYFANCIMGNIKCLTFILFGHSGTPTKLRNPLIVHNIGNRVHIQTQPSKKESGVYSGQDGHAIGET